MSGGHYPSYNHIQPSQEFVAPRHRLPTIAPPRPTSPYNSTASISHAHTAPSSWINKRSKIINILLLNENMCFKLQFS